MAQITPSVIVQMLALDAVPPRQAPHRYALEMAGVGITASGIS